MVSPSSVCLHGRLLRTFSFLGIIAAFVSDPWLSLLVSTGLCLLFEEPPERTVTLLVSVYLVKLGCYCYLGCSKSPASDYCALSCEVCCPASFLARDFESLCFQPSCNKD